RPRPRPASREPAPRGAPPRPAHLRDGAAPAPGDRPRGELPARAAGRARGSHRGPAGRVAGQGSERTRISIAACTRKKTACALTAKTSEAPSRMVRGALIRQPRASVRGGPPDPPRAVG